ncbi:MAG: hypothetical protein HC777_00015 [Hyphomonadaceae bacterium]|nr:hypothetical protein [Hyphomonadaceae bacterium]
MFPYDSFRWRGLDGSEVIAHFPPTHFAQDFQYGNLRRQWSDYREKHIAEENLFIYGWGDGGGGPTRMMVEHSQRAARFPGLPKIRAQKSEAFFDRLADNSMKLPVWDDELYMEGHRGTYTSKGALKRANRRGELLYRDVEMLSSFLKAFGGPMIQERLNVGWKHLLLNQFHDTLTGSHVGEAMPDILEDYCIAEEIAETIKCELLSFLGNSVGEVGDLVVVNTLHSRKALIKFKSSIAVHGLEFDDGHNWPVQKIDDGYVSYANLPSHGWATARLLTKVAPIQTQTAAFGDNRIDTNYYSIHIGTNGQFTRIYDKVNEREVLSGEGNVFQVFEDDPGKSFGAWDIAYHFEEYRYPVEQTSQWKLIDNGAVFARFSPNGKCSTAPSTNT